MVSLRVPRIGYINEESFTGTWAYDQVWDSLSYYGKTEAVDTTAFEFKQTGPENFFPNGFEFGPRNGRPVFALIMRHYGTQGPKANRMIRSEIKNFFVHGVQVVWEVDVNKGPTISVYRVANQNRATVYKMGEIAEAEPALPGWRMAVSELSYYRDDGILSVKALQNVDTAVEELRAISGKAEIVRGCIVHFAQAGGLSGWAADQIFSQLHAYAEQTKLGVAVGDNRAFLVDLPGRKSFSPSVAFYQGEVRPGFYNGAPLFAVEVKNALDYSNDGYGRFKAKIQDYFEAGTQVVWDVDVLVNDSVWVYRKDDPDKPTVYHRGDIVEAEPALPGWSIPVDALFWSKSEDKKW